MRTNPMEPVELYLQQFPSDVQDRLQLLRQLIKDIAPDAEESISYGIPAYKTHGKPLVYFAAFKNHIGLYATPSGHAEFAQELAGYKQGKGSVQFPFTEPLPLDLISRIIRFRTEENQVKAS